VSGENTKLVDVYRVLRESFMRLVSESLVHYSPRHGARVVDLEAEGLEEIFKMRAALEQIAIRPAASTASGATSPSTSSGSRRAGDHGLGQIGPLTGHSIGS
jgi:hypothetical protein